MSTNFYLIREHKGCDTCGHKLDREEIHIGKRSGMQFTFNSKNFESSNEWYTFLNMMIIDSAIIVDEYDSRYYLIVFWDTVAEVNIHDKCFYEETKFRDEFKFIFSKYKGDFS